MAKHVRKSYTGSPSMRKRYGVSQKAPNKMPRKKVFVKI